jgi:hypothetical protein
MTTGVFNVHLKPLTAVAFYVLGLTEGMGVNMVLRNLSKSMNSDPNVHRFWQVAEDILLKPNLEYEVQII